MRIHKFLLIKRDNMLNKLMKSKHFFLRYWSIKRHTKRSRISFIGTGSIIIHIKIVLKKSIGIAYDMSKAMLHIFKKFLLLCFRKGFMKKSSMSCFDFFCIMSASSNDSCRTCLNIYFLKGLPNRSICLSLKGF